MNLHLPHPERGTWLLLGELAPVAGTLALMALFVLAPTAFVITFVTLLVFAAIEWGLK